MASDDIVLDYHDSLLRKSDVNLLQSPNWLNDTIIGFVFEYFERNLFKDFADKVAFISPDTVQFLKLGLGDDIGPCIEPLQLSSKNLIFFPINDNNDSSSIGGTHWSLLLFNRDKMQFEHYDSYGGSNITDAKIVTKVCAPFIGASKGKLQSVSCPQQSNGCDCGMYVLCFAQFLTQILLTGQEADLNNITPDFVKKKRKDWTEIIMDLSKEMKK